MALNDYANAAIRTTQAASLGAYVGALQLNQLCTHKRMRIHISVSADYSSKYFGGIVGKSHGSISNVRGSLTIISGANRATQVE